MKHSLSTPLLAVIAVVFAGFLFPLIFGLFDKLFRELLAGVDPVLLTLMSFAWLLGLYFFGIKFSLAYLTEYFEIRHQQLLFTYSNILFALVSLFSYSFLISQSLISNLVWGIFYLCTMGFFYRLASKAFLQKKA